MNTRNRTFTAGRAFASLACGIALAALAALAAVAHAAGLSSDADPLIGRLAGVENIARPYPWLFTGGQPDAVALGTLAEAGVRDVVNLRTANESDDFDERSRVKAIGLRYLAIPTGYDDFSDARFTAFRHQLIAHGPKKPLFVHCASGDRVGAALLPWLVLDQGMSEEQGLELAREIGLRDPVITQRARDYIRARR